MTARNFKPVTLFALVLLTFNLANLNQTYGKQAIEEPAAATLQPAKIVYYAIPG